MTTDHSSSNLLKDGLRKDKRTQESLVTDSVMNDGLVKEPLLQDSAATQPPFVDEHDFNVRLADDDNYDGLTFEVIEAEVAEGKRVVGRGVYLAPNLITTLSLLSGFYSILASTQGEFYKASLAIFLSAILDGADGRVARMLNAQSPFGEQYDSLADMLAFGVAPAILVYSFALQPLGRIAVSYTHLRAHET